MSHDLIIIGAGPAGMAAALMAAKLGLKTALLDEQPRPGGQIYRNVTRVSLDGERLLGPDYVRGKGLADSFSRAQTDRHFDTTVWDITPDFAISALSAGRTVRFSAKQLIVATGAMERPSPIPGWTLPGVLNAGAAQVAMKSGSRPSGRIVLAGGGPLLLLVACQLLDAGAELVGLIETSPASNRRAAARHVASAMMLPKLLAKGLAMTWRLKQAGIPWFTAARHLAVEGSSRVHAVRFQAAGQDHRLNADVVLLHHGVVPNTQISRLLRVDHDWNDVQVAWQPRLGAFGVTSLEGFRIAGDGGGIGGALAAAAAGELATIGAAQAQGRITAQERDRIARRPDRVIRVQHRIRPFLDWLYRPPEWITAPSGDTIVCRCEEVTAQQIADMARLGCRGPSQTKFFSRCGMGPCQGRVCGLPVAGVLARVHATSPAEIGAYRIRSPLKPVPLLAIGQIDNDREMEINK